MHVSGRPMVVEIAITRELTVHMLRVIWIKRDTQTTCRPDKDRSKFGRAHRIFGERTRLFVRFA
jgi:hypothetical protein